MNNLQFIGPCEGIEEGGKGIRFDVRNQNDEIIPAFVIRFDGQWFAYQNICGHIAVQLDYMPGEFFSDDGQTLVCATHGAEYAPDTGACLGGPCFGVGLEPLIVIEQDENLYLQSDSMTIVHEEQTSTE